MRLFDFNHQDSFTVPSFNSDENDQQNITKSALTEVQSFQNGNNEYTKNENEQQLELLIGNLLKYGVIIACSTVLVGGVLYLAQCGLEPAEYQFYQGQPSLLYCPRLLWRGILSGSHNSIIVLGLLLLIAIPVVRIVLSLFTFIKQRDFTYTIMTFLALSGLIYSFIGAYY
ncbi:DUF1634 domain-containing protein [Anabaena azotica]|uniref:DUF1634 domain-containing protein n=1 Tax=Anabaena azotica FACHB-119 TaxID=947527 RepID=A0ABR8CX35_9NOST|nr:DUF1634 domain-containing protein [Anabaena azotica]MBD2499485.1 DUF1634 domain-containing protein [Anabaena azotica FACHB-119]